LTKRLGIEDNVIFTGKIKDEDLPQYFAACDVFVLPSISMAEGFGMVSLEAMATGKPVIGSNIGGIPFVLDKVGLLTKPRDVKSLSKTILKILNNEKLAKRIGKNSREKIEKMFTIKKFAESTESVYKSL